MHKYLAKVTDPAIYTQGLGLPLWLLSWKTIEGRPTLTVMRNVKANAHAVAAESLKVGLSSAILGLPVATAVWGLLCYEYETHIQVVRQVRNLGG